MSAARTLPLGIDVGSTRTRVALAERAGDGTPRLVAVAARPTGDDPAATIRDALDGLSTRERRCVLGIGAPLTQIRSVEFPPLSRRERERAARFEAARSIGYSIDDATLCIVPLDAARCALAIAPQAAIAEQVALARAAGLRLAGIDDRALALLRCAPNDAAVLDVGLRASVLLLSNDAVPTVVPFAMGGATFTDAIARGLGIDARDAERRKLTVGLGGAGDGACDAFITQLAGALTAARSDVRGDVRRLVLTGNGSRLIGFCTALENWLAMPVQPLEFAPHVTATLPADVVRAAAPDWALAYGLALWETAA